jgi:glycosyltransferase involved in cell wall biosynthesis
MNVREPITLVVPCFNEETCLGGVMREFSGALRRVGQDVELIVVDDGSTDGTAGAAAGSGVEHRLIRHRANRGYGAAIKSGIRAASHEWIAVVDGDGQHSPDELVRLLDLREQHDMVVGRRGGKGSPFWRRPGKWVLKVLCEVLVGRRIPDLNCGLRVFRREEAVRLMGLCSDQFSFSTTVTLAYMSEGLSVAFVPVRVRPRLGGRSQVRVSTGLATLMLILRTIGTFSPLKIFMPPTVVLFVVGAALVVHGLARRNVGDVAILCVLISVVLFCFGLLADQLALLRREIKRS